MIFPENVRNNIINMKERKNNIYTCDLVCCGQNSFEIYSTYKDSEDIVCIAKCPKCLKEYEIYNSLIQGYDNCIDVKRINKNIKLNSFRCKKCKENNCNVHLKYEYPPIDELKEDNIEPISNAFSWIWISFECTLCGKKYKNFINEETS